jgi:hypothetical protein
MDTYLSEHPQIFMAKKEQHFFGSDLGAFWPQPDSETYLATFADGQNAALRGESSGWYLLSTRAAEEIYAYNPNARIVALLRNPIDMLPSLHSQFVYDELEDTPDFREALDAEEDRRHGRRVPRAARTDIRRLMYHDVVRYDEQLRRYFNVFGEDQVLVVLFDDLKRDALATYREVLRFLGADPEYQPSLEVMNPQKRVRSRAVQHLVGRIVDPSSSIRRVGTRLVRAQPLRSAMLNRGVPLLTRLNTSSAPRTAIDDELHQRLVTDFAADVRRLGDLIDRDLGHWLSVVVPQDQRDPGLPLASLRR